MFNRFKSSTPQTSVINADEIAQVERRDMHSAHLSEIKMINEVAGLIEGIEAGSGNEHKLKRKLYSLLNHTIDHFAHEERLMMASGFPPFAMHKGAHEQFLAYMRQQLSHWENSGEIEPLANFVRNELPPWMKQHIETMDSVTAGFLTQQRR